MAPQSAMGLDNHRSTRRLSPRDVIAVAFTTLPSDHRPAGDDRVRDPHDRRA